MHLGNQPGELIEADPVMPHIAGDNAFDEPRIELSCCAVLFHRSRPQCGFCLSLQTFAGGAVFKQATHPFSGERLGRWLHR